MITPYEQAVLNHILMFGSDGYDAYITGSGSRWIVENTPKVFTTKHAAVAYFESYLQTLRDRKAGRE